MMRCCALLLAVLLAFHPKASLGQTPAWAQYMQLFFAGPNWLAGHGVVQYVPAFKGKTEELVAETDATRQLSPDAFMKGPVVTTSSSGTSDGAAADFAKEKRKQAEVFDKAIRLQEDRTNLARAALNKALNEVAAEGWEVVQMTAYGNQGGLVYLLKRR